MGDNMKYMYITNNPEMAVELQRIGVDIIWIDLEKNGKYERQKHIDSVKSNHTLEDVKRMSPFIKSSKLMVRINPIFENSKYEIDKAIEYGADIIMLPMFKNKREVEIFFKLINGRCKTVLLLETKEAVENLDDILTIKEIENIHIGLNDLSLSYGYKFMFESLANGLVEKICKKIHDRKISYGFGGIAQIGTGTLPAELILSEHMRLSSDQVILSRSFSKIDFNSEKEEFIKNFSLGIERLKKFEELYSNLPEKEYYIKHMELENIVNKIVEKAGEANV